MPPAPSSTPTVDTATASRPREPPGQGRSLNPASGAAPRAARHLLLVTVSLGLPLLGLSGDRPDYYAAYHADSFDLAFLAGLVMGLPVLVLLALERLLVALSGPRGEGGHRLLVGLLGFLVGVELAGWGLLLTGIGKLVAAVVVALVIDRYLSRWPADRLGAALASLPSLALAAWFALASPAAEEARRLDPEVGPSPPQRERTAVLVVFDAFPLHVLLSPDGSIDADRFPAFARLAGQASFFPRATTHHAFTPFSIASMLTGELPSGTSFPTPAELPGNLIRRLGTGRRVKAVEGAERVVPRGHPRAVRFQRPRSERLLSILGDGGKALPYAIAAGASESDLGEMVQRLNLFLRDPKAPWLGMEPDRASGFRELVASLGPEDRGAFLYLYTILPHAPWYHLPDGTAYLPPPAANGIRLKVHGVNRLEFTWTDDAWLVRQAYQRLVLQAGFADRLLGELLDRLEALGLFDDALVIVTSDHGSSQDPGSLPRDPILPGSPLADRGLAPNPEEILSVPLLVKRPGQLAGEVSERTAELSDIAPTIADSLGLPAFASAGRSLLATDWEPRSSARFVDLEGGLHRVVLRPEALMTLVAARRAWFAAAPEGGFVYRLGPHGDLVGRTLAADTPTPGGPTVALRWLAEGAVAGEVRGLGTSEVHLALLAGDRVVAVTRTVREEGGKPVLLAFVDPGSGITAGNPLAVAAIDRDPDGAPRLVRLELTSSR